MSLTKQASLTEVPFLADWPMAQNMCFSIECRFLVFQSVSSLQSSFETTSTCVLSRLRGVTLVEKFVLPQPAMVKLFPSSFVSGNLYLIKTYWVWFQTKIVYNSKTCLSKENMLVWWIEKMTPSSSVWLGRCRGDCFYSWTSCVCGLWQHRSILPLDFVRRSSVGVCQEQRKIGMCPSCTSSDQLVGQYSWDSLLGVMF